MFFRSSAKDTNSSGMNTHAIWMSLTFELFSADDDNWNNLNRKQIFGFVLFIDLGQWVISFFVPVRLEGRFKWA